ncbi:MAG: DNA-binding response regulator [Gammaproteobacteria bacterium]|jgi:two-component system response regulator CpxR|nr:DNA-binding response regulator [Gammaproteobacteria bacterium]NBR16505.1 DNA-binding response regulator [Gammaproteobacteria bacterium]NCW21556.1 DNA-binding response regulator [Gammaproteobacteria bacterium]NDB24813.1 DNA-binding response regulator [Gammaproteobacteria bacterium]NDE85970.1 DNA-binding response regulator [Gammaproteobacteria bacterium]
MSAGILIVDDDRDLSSMLAEFLGHEGFQVATIEEGGGALGLIAERPFDLVILDVMLPGSSGFDVLREIRQRKPRLPVLMLTARGEAIDRILGLELGADDYLPKPFDPRELAARVRAILRRAATVGDNTQSSESADSFFVGTLRMDIRRRRATLGGAPLELTGAEFRVLQHLAESRGQPVDRRLLTERALGRTLTLYDRSIDTHVSNLRRKLERQGRSGFEIRSVRGTGYELIETESAS